MKRSQIVVTLTLAALLFGVPLLVHYLPEKPASQAAASPHYLGFWIQEDNILNTYQGSPSQFASDYFGTPPYPASLEMMIFSPIKDGMTCAANTQNSIDFWKQVASEAQSYPNARIEWMIAFDLSTQQDCFAQYVSALSPYSSTYSLGIEGEYAKNVNLDGMQTAMNAVTAAGKQFVNYYVGASVIPSGGFIIGHTNFPGGDRGGYNQVGTLSWYNSSLYVGEDSGYYDGFPFPASVTCPIGDTSMNAQTAQWNQCTVNTVISTALQQPGNSRMFVNLVAGFAGTVQNENQLWNNQQIRGWIYANPQYQNDFILSTSNVVPPSTTFSTYSSNSVTSSLSTATASSSGCTSESCTSGAIPSSTSSYSTSRTSSSTSTLSSSTTSTLAPSTTSTLAPSTTSTLAPSTTLSSTTSTILVTSGPSTVKSSSITTTMQFTSGDYVLAVSSVLIVAALIVAVRRRYFAKFLN